MSEQIKVQATGTDRKVLLWEVDASHPGGDVTIANDRRVYLVGHTAEVARFIREGKLAIVPESTPAANEPVEEEQPAALPELISTKRAGTGKGTGKTKEDDPNAGAGASGAGAPSSGGTGGTA